ncbi:MAG TPA: hypothetical protein PLL99_00685 [Chitinophagales bacterium]|nr:hypothetical protein [Chitinophagales bacterium]
MKFKIYICFSIFFSSISCFAQQNSEWGTWDKLVGTWKGEYSGQLGKGGGVFTFAYDLNTGILIKKGRYEFPATAQNAALSIEDVLVIYPEGNKQCPKAIYFDNNGHTVHYTTEQTDSSVTLISEKLKNKPYYKITYTLAPQNSVDISTEISKDGIQYTPYLITRSRRTK